jgi:hypothetical protein
MTDTTADPSPSNEFVWCSCCMNHVSGECESYECLCCGQYEGSQEGADLGAYLHDEEWKPGKE